MGDIINAGPEDISGEVTLTEIKPRFSGTYSDVYIGIFRNKMVAVKIIKAVNRKSLAAMRRKMLREREVWAALGHLNVAPCYGYAEDDEEKFGLFGAIISPWYENGDAGKFLEAHGEEMDIMTRSTLWEGVISGVHYLHTHSPVIVHGDLKPGNILIDDQLNPRICDFGLARILVEGGVSGLTTTSVHTGTERYLAYELVASEDMCSPTTFSDVHALGCIGFEFIYLQLPYANRISNTRGHIFFDIRNEVPPARRPSTLSEPLIPLWDILDTCWRLNPEERVNTKNLIESYESWHRFIIQDDSMSPNKSPRSSTSTLSRYPQDITKPHVNLESPPPSINHSMKPPQQQQTQPLDITLSSVVHGQTQQQMQSVPYPWESSEVTPVQSTHDTGRRHSDPSGTSKRLTITEYSGDNVAQTAMASQRLNDIYTSGGPGIATTSMAMGQSQTTSIGERRHIAELSQHELLLVKYAALSIIAKSPLGDPTMVEEMIEWLEARRDGFWNKLFNKGDKKNVKKTGVFWVPLELLVEREGVDSMLGSARVPVRVPSVVDDIVSAMKQMDMSVEGIFRKNGNIRRMNQAIEALDRDPASVDLSMDDPVQLAAFLKRFLRDLPDPLLTFKLHRLWIQTQNIPDPLERGRLIHMVMLLLPRSHRDTLEVLLVFLKWVASFSHVDEETGNKMGLGNLATAITPNILRTNKQDVMHDESLLGIKVVTELLEKQDELHLVPEKFMALLAEQTYFMPSLHQPRELLKKIDTFLVDISNNVH